MGPPTVPDRLSIIGHHVAYSGCPESNTGNSVARVPRVDRSQLPKVVLVAVSTRLIVPNGGYASASSGLHSSAGPKCVIVHTGRSNDEFALESSAVTVHLTLPVAVPVPCTWILLTDFSQRLVR